MALHQLLLLIALMSVSAWFLGRARALGALSPLRDFSQSRALSPLKAFSFKSPPSLLKRSRSVSERINQKSGRQPNKLAALPKHYGAYSFCLTLIPALLALMIWEVAEGAILRSLVLDTLPENILSLSSPQAAAKAELIVDQVFNLSRGSIADTGVDIELIQAAAYLDQLKQTSTFWQSLAVPLFGFAGLILALVSINPTFQARHRIEQIVHGFLLLSALIAILTTLGIVLSVLFESLRFFGDVNVLDFMFGTHWSPQSPIDSGEGGPKNFGALPLFLGTLLISVIALSIAVPLGLMIAIYLAEYAGERSRTLVKPMVEMLAGIPTVVYGFIAALSVAPAIRVLGAHLGLSVSSESALAAGVVMGVMIIPFVSSLSDDVINAVPQSLRNAALALGATRSEMIRHIVLPAALPGIMGAVLLAASRAIGETMIVVMAAGLAAKLTANPLDSVTTITVQIVTLLTGDQEFDSPKTLVAFALGLMLFMTTLILNIYALFIVKTYSEQYH